MAKYYCIETYTCYCGEVMYHYIEIPDGHHIEDYYDLVDQYVDEDAYEWWDDDTLEEFDGDYEAYRAECGADVYEIKKLVKWSIDCMIDKIKFTEEELGVIMCALNVGMVQASLDYNDEVWERFNEVYVKIAKEMC